MPIAMSRPDRIPDRGDDVDRAAVGGRGVDRQRRIVRRDLQRREACVRDSAGALGVLFGRRPPRAVRVEADPLTAGTAEQRVDRKPGGLPVMSQSACSMPLIADISTGPPRQNECRVHDLPEVLDPA